jgi:beta-lactamase superfamily II metal-dependent hydrolase
MKIKFLQASKGDCFLVSFKDKMNFSRNILIDGGVSETYFDSSNNNVGELKLEVERIKKNNEKIDLLILSHIDNDHILGLLKWFETDESAYKLIENVWFNSGKLIAEYLKEPENSDLKLGLKIFSNTDTGANEAIEFEKYLLDHKIWDKKIIQSGCDLDQNGVSIKILSPNNEQLYKLLKEYKNKTGDPVYTSGKSKDWNMSFKELIRDEELNYVKPRDDSPKNQSSISFIITVDDKSFLFLADAPSFQIIKALQDLDYSEDNPLNVEFMKVSHHGSQNSTCNELLKIVKTENYLISTDSSSYGHPNKRTLARILRFNPNVTFHFNYDHVKNEIIKKQDFDDFKYLKAFVTKEFPY